MRDLNALLAALRGGTVEEQRLAALKLGAMRNPLVVPELIAVAARSDDDGLRALIASALAALGDAGAVRPALAHRDARARLTGVMALRHMPGEAAVDLLRAHADDANDRVRAAVVAALAERA